MHDFGLNGRIEVVSFDSDALKGNVHGDPTVRGLPVYLPPGYEDDPDRKYPVAFDLTGYTGSGWAHLNWQAWRESVPQRADRLISEGAMGPMIIAFPDLLPRSKSFLSNLGVHVNLAVDAYYYCGAGALYTVAAVGLLRLQAWARWLAIGLAATALMYLIRPAL